jgi:hypothetical protein
MSTPSQFDQHDAARVDAAVLLLIKLLALKTVRETDQGSPEIEEANHHAEEEQD